MRNARNLTTAPTLLVTDKGSKSRVNTHLPCSAGGCAPSPPLCISRLNIAKIRRTTFRIVTATSTQSIVHCWTRRQPRNGIPVRRQRPPKVAGRDCQIAERSAVQTTRAKSESKGQHHDPPNGPPLTPIPQVEEEAAKHMSQMKLIVQGTPGQFYPTTPTTLKSAGF
jgi:hypothetical protein